MQYFEFPVKIISSAGCLSELKKEISSIGKQKPLVVTDPGIVDAGILDKLVSYFKEFNIEYGVFEEVEPDPKVHNVKKAVKRIKSGNFDLVIGLGGGSAIDAAKASCVLANNDIDLVEYQGPKENYPQNPLPLITIPTTAGTGSEVSSAAVIVDEKMNYKMFFKSPQIFSKVAFLDSDLLMGIPNSIAAETGADALTHAFESFFNPNANFVTEQASLGAIELIFANLRAFVADTRNQTRAQQMLNASCLAGIAMTTAGLGLVHGIAHPLGVRGRIGHGLACGMLLPHILHFNWLADPERFLKLACPIDWTIRVQYPRDRDASLQVIKEVEILLQDIGIPKNLSDVNVTLEDSGKVIEEAYNSFLNQINPRPARKKELEEIVCAVM